MFKSAMFKNQQGFTIIELMIAGLISVMVLGGSIYVFNKQDKLIRQENASTNLRAQGRLAMTELTTDLRRTGYGVPAGAGIWDGQDRTLTILANTLDTDPATPGIQGASTVVTADILIASSPTTLTVADSTGFTVGSNIAIYDASHADSTRCSFYCSCTTSPDTQGCAHFYPYSPTTYFKVTATTATTITNNYPVFVGNFTAANGIIISQYQELKYNLDMMGGTYGVDNGRLTVQIDGGTAVPVVNNVFALDFDYFDENGVALTPTPWTNYLVKSRVKKIVINMTLRDPKDDTVTLDLTSDINIRNNG